jgi:hypothetical protein
MPTYRYRWENVSGVMTIGWSLVDSSGSSFARDIAFARRRVEILSRTTSTKY